MRATIAGEGRPASEAERLLREGRLDEALQALVLEVRADSASAPARMFLFQLLAASGEWARAKMQLEVAVRLDASNALSAAAGSALIEAEEVRAAVFSGERLPTAIGEPGQWLARLLQAVHLDGRGEHAAAAALRASAFEEAPVASGRIDDVPFAWLADADTRFGPCLELVLESGYVWAPYEHIRELRFEAPETLADTLWAPVAVTWRNGGQAHGYVPVRYPGSETAGDPALRLGRASDWSRLGEDTWIGHGQRMFATDAGEYPILEVRTIVFDDAG
jgi:type VI secretion system protein ImpE